MNPQNPIAGSLITQICVYGSVAVTLLQMSIGRGLIDFTAGSHALGAYSLVELWLFQFLHLSPLHLLSNMIFWVVIGPAFERIVGVRRAGLFCILSTIGIYASILAFSTASVGGMSGLLLAVLGALTVIYYQAGNLEYKSMFLLLGINIIIGFVGNISLTAHAAGAVIGVLLGFIWLKNSSSTNRYS
jgi:membrane associated rhomboid family serine protease